MKNVQLILMLLSLVLAACKKEGCTDPAAQNFDSKAKKDDGSCSYEEQPLYTVPSTYQFNDEGNNNTVEFSAQTERLNQLREMVLYLKTGTTNTISAIQLKDMFSNANENANGAFSFSSSSQLKDKCFDQDRNLFESWMDSTAAASVYFGLIATSGQAGILTSDTTSYLVSANGIEYLELIEKGLMGAVFMHQALNVHLSSSNMSANNTTAVDPTNGLYYTALEHYWDEAFGCFGVSADFPTNVPDDFWGKYCDEQNSALGSNMVMMNNFLQGRAAIANNVLEDRNAALPEIKAMWEKIAAFQAMTCLQQAIDQYSNPAKRLHHLSEAYGFILCLRYSPADTRKMTSTEVSGTLNKFGENFWNLSITTIQEIQTDIDTIY